MSLALVGCGSPPPVKVASEPPLALDPLADLAPAAGLEWILLLEPRLLPDVLPALYAIIPEQRFALVAARHGNVDPRACDEILVASYPKTTLVLARGSVDPASVEKAFIERAIRIEGRTVDFEAGPETTIVRTWGEIGSAREQLVLFGKHGVGFEIGAFGPLRAAELFAQGKLKKASPAFRSPPLDLAAKILGKAPARLFFSGPFEGEMAGSIGGVLRVASAVAIAAHPMDDTILVQIAILGIENRDMDAAAQRLAATFDNVAQSSLGRLCGLDKPKKQPTIGHSEDALVLQVTLETLPIGKGLHDATQASVAELLKL
jgi:hypothetical protein